MSLKHVLGKIGNIVGRENEDRFDHAFAKGPLPEWLHCVIKGTPQQDARGIDFIAATDVGTIYVQVKSSKAGKRKFCGADRGQTRFAIVILDSSMSEDRIRQIGISAIGFERAWILRNRRRT